MCEVQRQRLLFRKLCTKQGWNESCLITYHRDIIKCSNEKICVFILRIHFSISICNMEEVFREQDENMLIFFLIRVLILSGFCVCLVWLVWFGVFFTC